MAVGQSCDVKALFPFTFSAVAASRLSGEAIVSEGSRESEEGGLEGRAFR
jgi:hypothetical protein